MATNPAATAADVQPTPASQPTAADADSGTWSLTTMTTQADNKITINGAPVIYQAVCTFTLAGEKGGSPVALTDQVTLTASSTKLMSQHAVLRAGDQVTSVHGNTVSINPPKKPKLTSG